MPFAGGADSGFQGECPVGSKSLCDVVHSSGPDVPSFAGCAQQAEEQPTRAATFSLVRTMSWRLGSKTSNPASRTAAGRVFPAPKTPLIAMPVRPSHKARTTALRVASTWPSASLKRGSIACFSAYCSSFSMLADSRWQTAKVVMQQCATWYVLGA